MKIVIVSDSHDNMPNIDKLLDFVRQNEVEAMIHCGDICRPDVLQYFLDNFAGDIYAVHGNIDYDYFAEGFNDEIATSSDSNQTPRNDKKEIDSRLRGNDRRENGNDRLNFFGAVGKVEIAGKKVAFCHLPEQARELAESGEYDYVFYGHTHLPAQKMVGKCMMLNPGTLAGTFSRATFALWNTEENVFELKLLEKL